MLLASGQSYLEDRVIGLENRENTTTPVVNLGLNLGTRTCFCPDPADAQTFIIIIFLALTHFEQIMQHSEGHTGAQ